MVLTLAEFLIPFTSIKNYNDKNISFYVVNFYDKGEKLFVINDIESALLIDEDVLNKQVCGYRLLENGIEIYL